MGIVTPCSLEWHVPHILEFTNISYTHNFSHKYDPYKNAEVKRVMTFHICRTKLLNVLGNLLIEWCPPYIVLTSTYCLQYNHRCIHIGVNWLQNWPLMMHLFSQKLSYVNPRCLLHFSSDFPQKLAVDGAHIVANNVPTRTAEMLVTTKYSSERLGFHSLLSKNVFTNLALLETFFERAAFCVEWLRVAGADQRKQHRGILRLEWESGRRKNSVSNVNFKAEE